MPQGTRTGQNFFTKISNFFAYIPVLGAPAVGFFGVVSAWWDAAGWLLRLKPLSALTALGMGHAAAATNAAVTLTGVGVIGTVGSNIISGRNIGDNVRWVGESVVGAVTRPLGIQPTVLRSYTAGVGSMGGAGQPGPGYWASRAAQERGQDPNARYAAYRNGDGREHVAALESAAQSNSRGM
jgi:hypothetical protein